MAYSLYYEDAERADGTLESRRVGRFIGRVAADGMSERAAQREHDRIMAEVNQKRGSVAPTIHGKTFQGAVNAWHKAISDALSPATVRAMESHLEIHIMPKFKDSAPHELDTPALQQFATDLIGTLAPKTIENVLETIFAVLHWRGIHLSTSIGPMSAVSNKGRHGVTSRRSSRPLSDFYPFAERRRSRIPPALADWKEPKNMGQSGPRAWKDFHSRRSDFSYTNTKTVRVMPR
jgi:hypothetical protein